MCLCSVSKLKVCFAQSKGRFSAVSLRTVSASSSGRGCSVGLHPLSQQRAVLVPCPRSGLCLGALCVGVAAERALNFGGNQQASAFSRSAVSPPIRRPHQLGT